MKIVKPASQPAPKHLKARSKQFWTQLVSTFLLESHDLERLRLVCEQIDCIDECEVAIRRDGRITKDRYGCPKAHPAINVARDARQLLLRGLRELCVDVDAPEEARLPRQGRRYS